MEEKIKDWVLSFEEQLIIKDKKEIIEPFTVNVKKQIILNRLTKPHAELISDNILKSVVGNLLWHELETFSKAVHHNLLNRRN